jgi:hypothetical protein
MPPSIGPSPHYRHHEHYHESRAHHLPNPYDLEIKITPEEARPPFLQIAHELTINRQASIIARLALPFFSIILTSYALPRVVHHRFAQPTRSLMASMEMLLATFISNATVLVSLLQDRGYKKTKYKHGTERDGFHVKGSGLKPSALADRGIIKNRKDRWGSDEDLMRSSDRDDLSKNSDGKGETVISVEGISMVDLKRGNSMRARDRSRSRDKTLPEPPKAKLREIRVANTWEIRVEDSEEV